MTPETVDALLGLAAAWKQPEQVEDMRSALLEMDTALRAIHGAPHQVEDHGLAHAWVRVRAALWPAGSRAK